MGGIEQDPDTENVVYIDEYPHLAEKIRLQRLGQRVTILCEVFVLPEPPDTSA